MNRRSVKLALLIILVSAACQKLPKPPTPPTPNPQPTPVPSLTKTFGQALVMNPGSLLLEYKNIRLLVDPSLSGSSLSASDFATIDYVLLTDARPEHFDAAAQAALRKNVKMLCPPSAVASLNKAGFTMVKGLTQGKRLLLQKEQSFLFVSGAETKGADHVDVNAYLLEFDNGRNVLITGSSTDKNKLQSYLYGLRDDGKEIDLMFTNGGFRSKEAQSPDESLAADLVALFQPKLAVVMTPSAANGKFDGDKFSAALKEDIFDGGAKIAAVGNKIDF